MSNTGKGKKLASFNCDQEMWEQFIARCQSKGTTATAMLTNFIGLYLDDSLNDLDPIAHDKQVAGRRSQVADEEENALKGGALTHFCSQTAIERRGFRPKSFDDLEKNLLNSRIKAMVEEYLADSHYYCDNNTNQRISAIYSRLEQLESQAEDKSNGMETQSSKHLGDLEQKIDSMTSRMTQLADAILKIQNYLNSQPKPRQKSYSNNSYYQRPTPRIQALTQEGLASRLGVNPETVSEQRMKLPPPLFVAWSKGKDSSGIGWEFHESTGLYEPVT